MSAQAARIETAAPEGRVAQRRAKVRERLLRVAERLIARRGVEAVTIDDIAEAADIGRRTFYHHFDGKHAMLVPLAAARTKALNRRIDRLVAGIGDPALVMATALRHGLRGISEDPLCRWFVLHSGLPHERIYEAMGESGMRDVGRAVAAGRFEVGNADVVRLLLSGAFVAVLAARVEGRLDDDDLDDAAAQLLCLFGVPLREARRVARRSLPPLPPDPGAA